MKKALNKQIKEFLTSHKNSEKKPILILLGPTASGKTALSLEIAEKFDCEIISADSRQIYRGMDIGTDKIPEKERRGIPHFMLDVVNPDERFTVAHFKESAEKLIDEISARGKLPLIVGGTGLYLRALTQNFLLPPEDVKLKKKLEKELAKNGKEFMHAKLKKLDPESAEKIHPNNSPYVLRALEIVIATGKPKSETRGEPKYEALQIGLRLDRETLFERIGKRVDAQIERGLADETQKLLALGFDRKQQSMRGLGYREMIQHLDGELTLEQTSEAIKKKTRDFAKRQQTWFKKDKDVLWIENV